jgi:hypothetical protein
MGGKEGIHTKKWQQGRVPHLLAPVAPDRSIHRRRACETFLGVFGKGRRVDAEPFQPVQDGDQLLPHAFFHFDGDRRDLARGHRHLHTPFSQQASGWK